MTKNKQQPDMLPLADERPTAEERTPGIGTNDIGAMGGQKEEGAGSLGWVADEGLAAEERTPGIGTNNIGATGGGKEEEGESLGWMTDVRSAAAAVRKQADSHDPKSITSRLQIQDWTAIQEQLNTTGYAIVRQLLTRAECDELIAAYADNARYRKTVDMRRYRFGEGEYRYYRYDLPDIVQGLREGVYPHIAPVANEWMRRLGLPTRYPATHPEMQALCHAEGQLLPTPLILRYGPGGYNTLHQDLYGEVYFPLQAVFVLNQDGVDFTGGEFVLTEQVPRAQSKARVIRPDRGDMVIFTTNFRPAEGSRGYYQAAMRHGISPVLSGLRYALGVIFHDATT